MNPVNREQWLYSYPENTLIKIISKKHDGHFILIKGSIHQEEMSIFNIYAPNIGAPTYIKKNTNGPKSTDRP
jgi:hypothetical protein